MHQLVLEKPAEPAVEQPREKQAARRRHLRRLVLSRRMAPGCLVVHADQGVGLFEGVEIIEAAGVPHACFRIVYAKGDKLFVPVENADLVTYFGPATGEDQLDQLGGQAWGERKKAFHDKLQEIAAELVRTAAERETARSKPVEPPANDYERFNSRFPHELTEDQASAIADVEADLRSGKLMDRLVCGDVGFGKTEVALRAAFIMAMSGRQVAVIAPTTPLCRQHFEEFTERFADFPVTVVELSRVETAKEATEIKKALRKGDARIVIGTHALLGKGVRFKDLGLLIIDEEQRFGVKQKEQLKAAATKDVNVLTMTATPIPRTLQLTLAGLRDVSVIATAPSNRKPVQTEALEFDALTIRKALLLERERGGQSFYVCPRLKDIDGARARISDMVPDASIVVAHGRMKPNELEAAMTKFVRRGCDVLLATNIIESGLNIPSANTLIMHRADMFGMAQLYQLRGRVGRSGEQGYVYLTWEPGKELTKDARQRLEYLAALQSLGSGFDLASRDLDIRGAGTLFGEEQSGHLRDIGAEMFERMLAEAVEAIRTGQTPDEPWTPKINTNLPVFIPEDYIADPEKRVRAYRQLAEGGARTERDRLIHEMERDYGPLPAEVRTLAELSEVKRWCRRHHVESIDLGPKGITMTFREGHWPDQARLVHFDDLRDDIDYRIEEKLIYRVESGSADEQLEATRNFMRDIDKAAGWTG